MFDFLGVLGGKKLNSTAKSAKKSAPDRAPPYRAYAGMGDNVFCEVDIKEVLQSSHRLLFLPGRAGP